MSRSVVTVDGDTVDSLCWAQYGRTHGVTEAVLAANPQLRHHPAKLPAGLTVALPPVPASSPARATVRLWS